MPHTTTVTCSDGTPLEVRWNDASWADLPFGFNGEHWTNPATAMDVWLDPISPDRAGKAFAEVDLPTVIAVQFAGPFQFVALLPLEGERLHQLISGVGELMARFGSPLRFWQDFCQPRIRDAVAAIDGPLHNAPMDEVAATQAYGLAQTFTSIAPIMAALDPLQMLLEARFGPEGGLLAHEVTQGGMNASQAVDAELASLAALAAGIPSVVRILERYEGLERRAALRAERSALPFAERFEAIVAKHSSRSFGWELSLPTWGEDPASVLGMVAAQVRAGTPSTSAASSADLREAARTRVREMLDGESRGQFEHLAAMLDGVVSIREDRAYWQMRLAGAMRLLLLARGRSLVNQGRLTHPDDILHLTPDEFEAGGVKQLQAQAAAARAEWERLRHIRPPAFIGAASTTPSAAREESVLRGMPCSRGVATGRARIVHSPDDIDRFELGDVLVCRMTTPAWTPMFGIASAVVAETGGPHSHPAITAGEYGIPCVLGVEGATTRIPDGAMVKVDGIEGTVRLAT